MPTLIDGSAQGWIAGVNGKAAEAAIAPCKSVRLFIWLVCLNGQEHGHILEKPDPSPGVLWLRTRLGRWSNARRLASARKVQHTAGLGE